MSRRVPKTSPTSLDPLTRDLFPETKTVLAELRSLILSTLPDSTEKVALGRRSLNFSHPNVGYFCRLRPVDESVALEFEFGVLLPDPDRILIGNSCARQIRYARIPSVRALPRAGIRRLLLAAVSLPPERSTRLALVGAQAKPVLPYQRKVKRRTPRAA